MRRINASSSSSRKPRKKFYYLPFSLTASLFYLSMINVIINVPYYNNNNNNNNNNNGISFGFKLLVGVTAFPQHHHYNGGGDITTFRSLRIASARTRITKPSIPTSNMNIIRIRRAAATTTTTTTTMTPFLSQEKISSSSSSSFSDSHNSTSTNTGSSSSSTHQSQKHVALLLQQIRKKIAIIVSSLPFFSWTKSMLIKNHLYNKRGLLSISLILTILVSWTRGFATTATTTFSMSIISTAISNYFQQGWNKFLLDWKTYACIPFVAAFVGWFTNYLAVQMIFYPIEWKGIPIPIPTRWISKTKQQQQQQQQEEEEEERKFLKILGWQGIIPAKTAKMSQAMVNVTINELLSMEETIQKLDPNLVAEMLSPEIPYMIQSVLDDDIASASLSPKLRVMAKTVLLGNNQYINAGVAGVAGKGSVGSNNGNNNNNNGSNSMNNYNNLLRQMILQDWLGRMFLKQLTIDVQNNITTLFNVENCVVNQMMLDRSLLGTLFQKTGGKELNFLIDSGLWFGFILGIIQMFLTIFVCEDPFWMLTMGGLFVGLATNWIALKWIFEPIEPTKFGPFVLQGKFLRRQKEVAKDFSNFFATRILNSEEVWKSILYDPTTSPNFRKLFAYNIKTVLQRATRGLWNGNNGNNNNNNNNISKKKQQEQPVMAMATAGTTTSGMGTSTLTSTATSAASSSSPSSSSSSPVISDDAFLLAATNKISQRLPYHFSKVSFHSYVDKTLDIETTLRTGLESMSSKKFEQILHPIFQEDELTLILAGGFLGFLAGFIQQLIATKKILSFL